MRRKIVRVGASLCILLPKDIIKAMEWDFGQYVDLILDEENQKIMLRNLKNDVTEKESYLEDFSIFMEEYKSLFSEFEKED